MKRDFDWAFGLVIGVAMTAMVIFGMSRHEAKAEPHKTNTQDSGMLSRACSYKAGGGTLINCSAAAAYSAQLNKNSRYVIQPHIGAVYIRQGTGASGQDPSSTADLLLPLYSAIDIYTRSGRYVACDGNAAGAAGVLHVIECQ